MILRFTAKGWCVVPRPKSQIISALFFKTYDFAVLKMGQDHGATHVGTPFAIKFHRVL